jgi:hypothetical protein
MVVSLAGCFGWSVGVMGLCGAGSVGRWMRRERDGRSSYLYWLVFVKVVMGLYLE